MDQRDETGTASITDIGRAAAPWGRQLVVQALAYNSGLKIARLRIQEGHRFTTLDLDAATTAWLAKTLRQALGQATAD